MADKQTSIGFVGMGAMGDPMARNLIKNGHELVVHDIDPAKNETFRALGATVAAGPADVARRTHVMISMVDTTAQAEDVIVGPGGFMDGATAGDVVISMSTIDPSAVFAMSETLAEKGIRMMDCPVTGMIQGAESGTLKGYAGGPDAVIEKARPVLEAMTSEVNHMGQRPGQGITVKLVNNMLAQIHRIAAVEAMVLGAKAGIDPDRLIEMISKTSGDSFMFRNAAPRTVNRDFTGIRMDITLKDMELEGQMAKSLNVPVYLLTLCQQIQMMAKSAGLGDEDPTAVVKIYEQITGVSLARA